MLSVFGISLTNIIHTVIESSRVYALSSRLRRNHDVRNVERFRLPEDNIPYRKSDYAHQKTHREKHRVIMTQNKSTKFVVQEVDLTNYADGSSETRMQTK